MYVNEVVYDVNMKKPKNFICRNRDFMHLRNAGMKKSKKLKNLNRVLATDPQKDDPTTNGRQLGYQKR